MPTSPQQYPSFLFFFKVINTLFKKKKDFCWMPTSPQQYPSFLAAASGVCYCIENAFYREHILVNTLPVCVTVLYTYVYYTNVHVQYITIYLCMAAGVCSSVVHTQVHRLFTCIVDQQLVLYYTYTLYIVIYV